MKPSKIFIILLVVILTLTSTSCSIVNFDALKIPSKSDNFSEKFMDSFLLTYQLYDPQLHYFSASPFEVSKIHTIDNLPDKATDIFLACIDDIPKEQFVAVVTLHADFESWLDGIDSSVFVYQRHDAPVPMRDYTVSSVSLLASINNVRFSVQSKDMEALRIEAQDYLTPFLSEDSSKILAEYTAKDHSELVSHLQNSYLNTVATDTSVKSYSQTRPWESLPGGEALVTYHLLFKFEETDNLTWIVPIKIKTENDKTSYYYGYTYYDVAPAVTENGKPYLSYQKNSVLAPISEEFAAILIENIP